MRPSLLAKHAGIGVVAGIAAYASYSHMAQLALDHGQTATVAALLPVSVDGMLIVATVVMREDRQAGHSVRPWAWLAFVLGVLASVVANVLAAAPDITSRVISAWPAIALLLVIEVLATGKKAAELPAEVVPSKPAERAELPLVLPAVVEPRPTAVKPARAPRKPAAAKPAKTTPRRPAQVTKELAAQALASAPDATRTAVAESLDITPRRLRQVLNADSGEQHAVNGQLPGQLSLVPPA